MDCIDEYKRVKGISNRERERLKWSLRIGGISGRIGTTTIDPGEILQGILDLLLLK